MSLSKKENDSKLEILKDKEVKDIELLRLNLESEINKLHNIV
jgi:hypothetical protein